MQPNSERLETLLVQGIPNPGTSDLQERKAVVAKLLDLLVPPRSRVRGRVTPRVVVESEKVTALVIGTAVHVLCHFVAVALNVGSGVANGNRAVATAANVLLQVTSDSLDIRSAVGGVVGVDDLVTREKEKSVGVACESVNSREQALQVHGVVRWSWIATVERVLGGVDIESEVDARSRELAHALVVVGSVVDSVHTDSVDSQLLELYDITLAAIDVRNGILSTRRAAWLVVDTTNVKALITSKES